MSIYFINLFPSSWWQTVTNRRSKLFRKLSAQCAVGQDMHFNLSTGENIHKFDINLSVFDGTAMEEDRRRFQNPDTIGICGYLSALKGSYDSPGHPATVSAWVMLETQGVEDIWRQVLQGEYSECQIHLTVEGLTYESNDFRWDVKKPLEITAADFGFQRGVKPQVEEVPEKSGFWSKGR